MARKVFISFLGTSNYLETYYKFDGIRCNHPVRFVQEAIIEFLCKDWTEDDRIIIFHTDGDEGSKIKNWYDNGQENAKTDVEKIGLHSRLIQMHLRPVIEDYDIPEGFSEPEIWAIFDCVYQKLESGDEIHFDVTHAFRSIPLFSIVLFNYAHYMKHTKIMSIYYGAFEELGPAYKVRNMEIEDRNASIINLTNIAKLQKLTETATEFTAFGKIKRLSENISAEGGHLEGKAASAIEEVCDAISDIDDYISTCRMNDIKKGSYMIHFTNNIQRVRNSILPNPIKIILESLQIELSEFKNENSYDNIKAAIKWARKYNMLPQAYTLSQEYIVSLVAERLKDYNPYRKNIKMKNTDRKKKFREFISAMLAFDETKELRDELKVHEEIVHSMLLIDWIKELRKEYKCLTKGRNSIDHAKGDLTASDLDDILKEYYPKCIKILESVPC